MFLSQQSAYICNKYTFYENPRRKHFIVWVCYGYPTYISNNCSFASKRILTAPGVIILENLHVESAIVTLEGKIITFLLFRLLFYKIHIVYFNTLLALCFLSCLARALVLFYHYRTLASFSSPAPTILDK